MRKLFIFTLVVLFIIVPYLNAEEKIEVNEKFYETLPGLYEEVNSTDFRNATWGMNIEQVKLTEKEIKLEDKNSLVYVDIIANLDCVVCYFFAKGKLVEAVYLIIEEHTNKNDYIDDYSKLKKVLMKTHGEPIEDMILWRNELFRDDSENWGTAISLGHLVYGAEWENEKTGIVMLLHQENYKIVFGISYYSKELAHLKEETDEAKLEEKF